MERLQFNTQIKRLSETYGERSYPPERILLLWKAFALVPEEQFVAVVDELIADSRHAPMLTDIATTLVVVRDRDKETRNRFYNSSPEVANASSTLAIAARKTSADKEIVQVCMETLRRRQAGKISAVHWEQACDLLDSAARTMGRVPCQLCLGSGHAVATVDGVRAVYVCSCSAGADAPKDIVGTAAGGVESRRTLKKLAS